MSDTTVGLYVIKDKVADDVGPVFSAKNDGVAKRHYNDSISQVKYPDDYQLIRVGYFDTKYLDVVPELYILIDNVDKVIEKED